MPSSLISIGPLFTGTAGVPPATRRRRAVFRMSPFTSVNLFSRFALIAGGTPAVPVTGLEFQFHEGRALDGIVVVRFDFFETE